MAAYDIDAGTFEEGEAGDTDDIDIDAAWTDDLDAEDSWSCEELADA